MEQIHAALSAPLAPAEEILCSRHSQDQGPVTRSGIACTNLAVAEAVTRGERPAPACAMVQTPARLPQWQRRRAQTTTCCDRRPLLEHPPPS